MFPKIIDIFGVPINSYGLMIMIGFLLATYIALRRLRVLPWPVDADAPDVSRAIAEEVIKQEILERKTVEKLRAEAEEKGESFKASVLVERKHVTEEKFEELKEAGSRRRTGDFVLDLAIISMIFGLLGGKLTYIIQNPEEYGPGTRIFDFTDGVHPAGALLGLVPFAIFWLIYRKRNISLTKNRVALGIVLGTTLIFALIGIRGLYLYLQSDDPKYTEATWRIFTTWQSGFVLYGGIIMGVLAGAGFCYLRKRPILVVGDIVAPSLMLGVALGRLGCFLNGCCYGTRCEAFWGIPFPEGSPPYNEHLAARDITLDAKWSLAVHPTQLYEAIVCIGLFFGLSKLLKKSPSDGLVLAGMAMAYAVWRFFVEFLRGDPGRDVMSFGNLSFSQTVSIFVFILGAAGISWLLKKKRRHFPELESAS